jgi:CubicO group peptidase (beta-lactamase class C family)
VPQRQIPAPTWIKSVIDRFLFLDPKAGESRLAYSVRRVWASVLVSLSVGLIAFVNLATVGPAFPDLRVEAWLVSVATVFVLANVFLHTAIGLSITRKNRTHLFLGCSVSAPIVVVSCVGFFWLGAGDFDAGRIRLVEWLWLAGATQVLMLAYAAWFDREIVRKQLHRPAPWRILRGLPIPSAVIALAAIQTSSTFAQEPDVATTIENLMAKKYPRDEPGAAVLVAKAGKVLYSRGFGLSNLEQGTSITGDTPFCIASTTKPFTAVAVLMLVEQGKLSLESRVKDVLPDYPGHAANVTIKHLLSHTAGIKDVSRLQEWRKDMRSDLSVSQVLNHFQDLPLTFQPGEKWEYSNSGYLLLGVIIEKITGKEYGRFVEVEIFAKAGMRNSFFGSRERLIPRRADGYSRKKTGYVNAEYVSMSRPYAAGGLICSVSDLYLFSNSLMEGKLLKEKTLESAFSCVALNSGEPTVYGLGWMVGTFRGHRVVQHSGGMPGFSAQMWLLPDDKVFAVLLSNSPDKTDQKLIGALVATGLGEPLDYRPKTIRVDDRVLRKHVGSYQLSAFGGDVVTVNYESGKLTIHVPPNPVCELHATNLNEFYVTEEDIQVTFVPRENDNDAAVVLHHSGLDLRARRIKE